jgi:hypothetical protein
MKNLFAGAPFRLFGRDRAAARNFPAFILVTSSILESGRLMTESDETVI